jgi:hypothetical protein
MRKAKKEQTSFHSSLRLPKAMKKCENFLIFLNLCARTAMKVVLKMQLEMCKNSTAMNVTGVLRTLYRASINALSALTSHALNAN